MSRPMKSVLTTLGVISIPLVFAAITLSANINRVEKAPTPVDSSEYKIVFEDSEIAVIDTYSFRDGRNFLLEYMDQKEGEQVVIMHSGWMENEQGVPHYIYVVYTCPSEDKCPKTEKEAIAKSNELSPKIAPYWQMAEKGVFE